MEPLWLPAVRLGGEAKQLAALPVPVVRVSGERGVKLLGMFLFWVEEQVTLVVVLQLGSSWIQSIERVACAW